MMLRMIAVKAASNPLVEITQDGETLSIKTSTTVRTTHITFTVGQEFNEATVDGRPCTVRFILVFSLSHREAGKKKRDLDQPICSGSSSYFD